MQIATPISIHALREEGDTATPTTLSNELNFYPRPPRGGRLDVSVVQLSLEDISIHALREEGDCGTGHVAGNSRISIHALREEGDRHPGELHPVALYFYPRPPRGGRLSVLLLSFKAKRFLSTPSARRATKVLLTMRQLFEISIHALREEGDAKFVCSECAWTDFYPRPPRGGRLQFTVIKSWGKIFLSTPSARRATELHRPD